MCRILSVLFSGFILLLSGCAHFSGQKVNCHRINWKRAGYRHALQGKEIKPLTAAFPSCTPLVVNKAAYHAGWVQGLPTYCTPANGYQRGLDGQPYSGFCPHPLNSAFLQAYKQGSRDFHSLSPFKKQYEQFATQLKHIQETRLVMQKRLTAMRTAYSQEAFSPEKQYQIQKTQLLVRRYVKLVNELQTKVDVAKNRYQAKRTVFIKAFQSDISP